MAEIAEAIVAAAEGVREVADVDAGAADVMAAAVVVAGMAVAGTAGEGTNFPQINFVSADFADLEKGLRLRSRPFLFSGDTQSGRVFFQRARNSHDGGNALIIQGIFQRHSTTGFRVALRKTLLTCAPGIPDQRS